jgi:hypothetical protein
MPITTLPTLDRTSPTFRADVDTFFGSQLPAFATEANALETAVNDDEISAAASAATATSQASAALTSANNAATSKTDADTARNAAQAAQTAAELALDSFDDRYLGAKAVAPTLDNDGNALLTGALYFDTVIGSGTWRAWNGSAWVTAPAANASAVVNTPAGNIAATTVQAAINELDTEKAKAGANTDITSLGAVTSMNGGQLAGLRNRIINGNFGINQRAYVSGAAVGAGLYGHDRWKMAASGDTYTFSTTANVTTITIPASKVLQQVIEGLNLETGTYTLSWSGTAQGKIGAGSLGASGITGSITGGTDTTIEFGPGTVSKVQLEFGPVATPFEHRPYGMELALCQRYYRPLPRLRVISYIATGNAIATTVTWPDMRTVPTVAGLTTTGSNFTDASFVPLSTNSGNIFAIATTSGNTDLEATGGTLSAEL